MKNQFLHLYVLSLSFLFRILKIKNIFFRFQIFIQKYDIPLNILLFRNLNIWIISDFSFFIQISENQLYFLHIYNFLFSYLNILSIFYRFKLFYIEIFKSNKFYSDFCFLLRNMKFRNIFSDLFLFFKYMKISYSFFCFMHQIYSSLLKKWENLHYFINMYTFFFRNKKISYLFFRFCLFIQKYANQLHLHLNYYFLFRNPKIRKVFFTIILFLF